MNVVLQYMAYCETPQSKEMKIDSFVIFSCNGQKKLKMQ